MSAKSIASDTSKTDEGFSVIEHLPDAMRIDEDVVVSHEDREAFVQDLYEGPRKCQCCINWMTECPHGVDLTELGATDEDDEGGSPLVIRRRVNPGQSGTVVSVHSVEIRHAATRKVLVDVFQHFDGIVQDVKYLTFLAPFHPFFWRWECFEKAIVEERDETVKKILATLRDVVKHELAGAFAVSKELVSHGLITFNYLWTLFAPGELIYAKSGSHDRFFKLRSCFVRHGEIAIDLSLAYVTWSWHTRGFGTAYERIPIDRFQGTRPISSLPAFPARCLSDFAAMQGKLTERGGKFASLAGTHYKAYHPKGLDANTELRVMIDGSRHSRHITAVVGDCDGDLFTEWTSLITQSPVESPPANGVHIPLEEYVDEWDSRPRAGRRQFRRPRHQSPVQAIIPIADSFHGHRSVSMGSTMDHDVNCVETARKRLTELHLQLTEPVVDGYDLKEKIWKSFEVDRISDIKWNSKPFESLVLPEGYKELILAFVESQVKDKEAFDDVINGKGGGLVALLAGDPGVGKTLTAESVAEKIHAPLFKMDLGDYDEEDRHYDRDDLRPESPPPRDTTLSMDFTTAFSLASRWGAVLLIDECDMYLEKRSDVSSKRSRMVSRFLKELEYYPSLLFLTTNRKRSLDPAVHSRIHLTINYPTLDQTSRMKIWRMFLEKSMSTISDVDLKALSEIWLDGRQIRNIAKTAGIMAKREDRTVNFEDLKKVMKITEGIHFEGPIEAPESKYVSNMYYSEE